MIDSSSDASKTDVGVLPLDTSLHVCMTPHEITILLKSKH